ncbi:transmembrane protein 72-like [Gigantopelta aegis]|uniref:transmembrane protein 72-like n=1 Tax=Gigantopelta aegis TaxID=1735272 RepID=UPI001B88E177|nr:transmembrane protein 72-like [Gigantopelta aegis]
MPMGYASNDCCCEVYLWTCRISGFIAVLVLSGAGVEAIYYGHSLGIYLLVIAFVIAVFESVFAVNFCVALDVGLCEKVKALKLWDVILWLDDWKKGLFYILLAIPCFIQPHKVLLALISGCLVFISGMFYMIKTFKTRREKRLEMLSQKESYDRFEDLQDDMIEDDIINPNTEQPMSVADQSEILEV